jgi:potassium efflux system protein
MKVLAMKIRNEMTGTLTFLVFLGVLMFAHGLIWAQNQEILDELSADKADAFKLHALAAKNALKSETYSVISIRQQLLDLKQTIQTSAIEINDYKLKLSAHANLLLSTETKIEDIEKAWAENQTALAEMADKRNALQEKRSEVRLLLKQTEEQFTLNQQQLSKIDTDVPNVRETQNLIDQFEKIIRLLIEKNKYLEELDKIYSKEIGQLEDTINTFAAVSDKFDHQIKTRKKKALFKRSEELTLLFNFRQIRSEAIVLAHGVRSIASAVFWVDVSHFLQKSGTNLIFSAVLFLVVVRLFLIRLRRFLFERQNRFAGQYPWRSFVFRLLCRSLLLFGSILFWYVYVHIENFYTGSPFVHFVIHSLIGWLFTQWALDFLALLHTKDCALLPQTVFLRLRTLFLLTRAFILIYVFLTALLGNTGVMLLFMRLCLLLTLLVWDIQFRINFQTAYPQVSGLQKFGLFAKMLPKQVAVPTQKPTLSIFAVIVFLGFLDVIIVGALILEIAGYGVLALYWLNSWGWSAVFFLWSALLFLTLKESSEKSTPVPSGPTTAPPKPVDSIRWLFIRIGWLIWFASLIISLLFAWGAKGPMIVGFLKFLNSSLAFGEIKLSILGFVYAIVILLFTHAASRLWQHILIKQILAGSGLELGLRTSIQRVTVYCIWGVGILLTLNVIGVSATSLTVVFGALGIGLGFGLQSIFNNFFSGIILLFERPIRVGDAIEIGGVWGEVKKIRFRSTLIRTYENASLIIPNSEIISKQVTNWSFKDTRIRRSVEVGVAYGADLQQVRQTLLDIADDIKTVLKFPRPHVLFTDFGDSALLFKLRFWCHIDDTPYTETAIRFEIDRIFAQKGIDIPYPQRDVHVYAKNRP